MLRVDPAGAKGGEFFKGLGMELTFRADSAPWHLTLAFDDEGNPREARRWSSAVAGEKVVSAPEPSRAQVAARKILELSVPSEEVGLKSGQRATFQIRLKRGGEELALEEVDMKVPPSEGRGRSWSVS